MSTNMSPATNVDFTETALYTQEFPYIDSIPQGYPNSNLETARSYHFSKLSDNVVRNKNWYDLLTADVTNDWFTKYFSIGYPLSKNSIGKPLNLENMVTIVEKMAEYFNFIPVSSVIIL